MTSDPNVGQQPLRGCMHARSACPIYIPTDKIGPVAGRTAFEIDGRRLGRDLPVADMNGSPHAGIGVRQPSRSERAAYRWLLELLLDAFARKDRRDAARVVVSAADGTVSVWNFLCRDHCPRCERNRCVYLCERTRALACLCRVCRTLEVHDGIGRPICLATSGAVASEDLPADPLARVVGAAAPLPPTPNGRVLPFVALWPPRQDRRTLTATPRPAASEPSQ